VDATWGLRPRHSGAVGVLCRSLEPPGLARKAEQVASIEKRVRSGKTRWYARYVDDKGKDKSKVFDRRADAERFLTSVKADLMRGVYVAPDDGLMTFREYALLWASIQPHRPGTVDNVQRHLKR
jgi:hypothetical protein